jgi:hypothetical protein
MFDSVCQSTADLGHESLLILRIPQALGGKIRRWKIKVRTGQLRVLPHRRLRCNALIPHHVSCRSSLLEDPRFSMTQRFR